MDRKHLIITAIAGVIVIGALGFFAFGNNGSDSDLLASALNPKAVKIASVAELSGRENSLVLSGSVSSVSEATIRAEGSGSITAVYRRLGDTVGAGTVIAEIENSGERASLLQAEGAYEAAEAQLAKAKQGADISSITVESARKNLAEAKLSARNTMESVYSTIDDAVRTKADALFDAPNSVLPRLIFQMSDNQLAVNLQNDRQRLGQILIDREKSLRSLNENSNWSEELTSFENDTRFVKKFFDDLTLALTKAIPTAGFSEAELEGHKATIGATRSAVIAALSSLPASRDNVNSRTSALSVAEKQAEAAADGAVSEDVAGAQASLKQMLGNLRAAQSRYEKTIIRSPITGTINNLSIERGDFVSSFQEVAVVSNNGALEVVAYITNDEAARIAVGSTVSIGENSKGVVARVAPALDPRTKKIEVRISITENGGLSNGETVRLSIGEKVASNSPILIPLSALRITADGPVVFKVVDSKLVKIPVVEGSLRGENIEIKSGLSSDVDIVVDARGLKEGILVEATRE